MSGKLNVILSGLCHHNHKSLLTKYSLNYFNCVFWGPSGKTGARPDHASYNICFDLANPYSIEPLLCKMSMASWMIVWSSVPMSRISSNLSFSSTEMFLFFGSYELRTISVLLPS